MSPMPKAGDNGGSIFCLRLPPSTRDARASWGWFPPYRGKALRRSFLLDRHPVELQPVVDELVAELLGDGFLQGLDLGVHQLHDLAGLHVAQTVVALVGVLLIAGAAVSEVVAGGEAPALPHPRRPPR